MYLQFYQFCDFYAVLATALWHRAWHEKIRQNWVSRQLPTLAKGSIGEHSRTVPC